MTEPLNDSKRQIAELIAMIAHDLRGQVTTIKGFNQLALRQTDQSSGIRDYLLVAIAEANRMAALIDDLVLCSQMDVHATIRIQPIEIVEVVRAAIERLKHSGIAPDLMIETDANDLIARCDPNPTERALALLIGTAQRYQTRNAPMTIAIHRGNDETVIEVLSSSTMASDKLRALRRAAGIVDEVMADEISSSGLGLYICHRLIALQEGRVWIEEPPNRGTTFVIALPGNVTDRETSPRGDRY